MFRTPWLEDWSFIYNIFVARSSVAFFGCLLPYSHPIRVRDNGPENGFELVLRYRSTNARDAAARWARPALIGQTFSAEQGMRSPAGAGNLSATAGPRDDPVQPLGSLHRNTSTNNARARAKKTAADTRSKSAYKPGFRTNPSLTDLAASPNVVSTARPAD